MGVIFMSHRFSGIKMDWLSGVFTLLLAVVTLATQASTSEPRVVCYYTNWSVYRPGTARFNPQNINPYLCTHLVYAFGGFTKENSFKPFDKYQDIEKGGYAKFTGLKTYNKNLKTLLAIGGWNEGSTRFSPMVASRERRREFVRNAIKFLRQNRFDGLDLDWEYPAFRDGGKAKDRENYAKLVKELREEFEKEAEKSKKPRLLLTMAVPAGIEYIQKGFDVKTLNQYLDWMNLLSYDYHSAFEPAVNHHAPLYPLEEPNEYSVDNELNIDYTIKFYLENGADPDKLVLGIPTYGRSYTLFNPDATEIGAPADGPGEQGDATREKGYLAYYEICESLKPKEKKPKSKDDDDDDDDEEEDEEDLPWTVVQPNPNAMGPFAYRGNQWVGYDDIDIVKKKAEYVAENGLGGIMFWSIDNDDFRGNCHGKPYPLIEAAKEAYVNRLGSTDNVVVKDKPSSTSVASRRRSRPRASTTVRPTTAARIQSSSASTTPSWKVATPEPPTTPDPGSDFKCTDEGFFPHPRDCKKYFWCLDSGPSNLGIVAHQFTCPSGLFFNKAADSCDFARNVLCKKPTTTTKAPTTTTTASSTTTAASTTRRPIKLPTKNSLLFRTTTTTTAAPVEEEEEYEDEVEAGDIEAEDPKVIKELIDLIKKVGGVEQLEKQLHLSEGSSGDGASTTTPSSFNKKLYQKVLERTRGNTRLSGNTLSELVSNSRRGPQNAGLEAADSEKSIRNERPKYTTINRGRSSTSPPSEIDSEEDIEIPSPPRSEDIRVSGGARPLNYVNIRRARPASTSDTADDTASRNALFERSEPFVSVAESPNSLDIQSARRENLPEYVTIRRTRPTTEETTTQQYEVTEEEDSEEDIEIPEKEISSSPLLPTYTSIVRLRPTTLTPSTLSTPSPTTVLAVKITSLLNNPTEEATTLTEVTEPETVTATATTKVATTTAATTTRRNLLRRRGTTTTTQPTPSTAATQVSARNYTFVRRRRPLARPNEITSESEDTNSRKIRSTTPDSREVDGISTRGSPRRLRQRIQTNVSPSQVEDSVPAAAQQVSRGNYRPNVSPDELLSLTPIDLVEEPKFIQRENYNAARNDRRFRSRISVVTEKLLDSDVSAATIEVNRQVIDDNDQNVESNRQNVPRYRGRSRFQSRYTTEALVETPRTESTPAQRRPFTRFTPRPFSRTITQETDLNTGVEEDLSFTTPKTPARLPFARVRPSAFSRQPLLNRQPPTNRQTTTQAPIRETDDNIEDKHDDISLSESAIEEQEHEDSAIDGTEDIPKRRIVIKKIRPTSTTEEPLPSSPEPSGPADETNKKRIKIVRRRPATTTEGLSEVESPVSTEATGIQRIRKIIRKKVKPLEEEPEIIAKSIGSVSTPRATTQLVVNYGDKTRSTVSVSSSSKVSESYVVETSSDSDEDENDSREEEDIAPQQKQELQKQKEQYQTTKAGEVTPKTEATVKIETQNVDNSDTKNKYDDSKEDDDEEEEEEEGEEEKDDDQEQQEEVKQDEKEQKQEVEKQDEQKQQEEVKQELTTKATTQETSPTTKSRLPYRLPKRIITSSTEPSSPSSRSYSRRYNGAYTSPSTTAGASTERTIPNRAERRPLFSGRPFTRKPYTTARTTEKQEEEQYFDDESDEEEPDNKIVFVPSGQLFTRKPNKEDDDVLDDEYSDEEIEEQKVSSRRPLYKPRVVNSNTFRTSTSTTELPKVSRNLTSIYNRFGSRPGVNDTKKRTQNIPVGYAEKPEEKVSSDEVSESSTTENEDLTTATEDDEYLSMTESTRSTGSDSTNTESDFLNTIDFNTSTDVMEIDNSTDDYLEYTENTTSYPIYDPTTENDDFTQTVQEDIYEENVYRTTQTERPTTKYVTTTAKPTTPPVYKSQFNKLFSVSRIVEVSSKLDKHRLTKDNKTKLIEEGQLMQEKKPTVDKIGEVSRFSLIRIIEDEIPIYLTKLGHVYPVDNPPDNPIRIDEARNARALVSFSDAPKENLIASESVNEQYRHVNSVSKSNTEKKVETVEKLPSDDFLSFINEDKKVEEHTLPYYYPDPPKWQFVPAAYENEKTKQKKVKSSDGITPRTEADPLTLPLEGLFKTENPITARKINNEGINKQPFLVYSATAANNDDSSNIMRLRVTKPDVGQAILTYVKGQELSGASVTEQSTDKYPVNLADFPLTTTESEQTTNTEIDPMTTTSPLVEMLTTQITTTEYMTTEQTTTETVPEETTTHKLSPLDARKSKFPFPRRSLLKPNVTRPNPTSRPTPKTINTSKIRKTNTTTTQTSKDAKKSGFNPNKSRFSAVRTQNVPIDVRKSTTAKPAPRNSSDLPRGSGDRKLYFKPIRPINRPGFVRRNSTQILKDRRKNFLRRTTKAPTVARSTIEPETSTDATETPKPTRRGISKFKAPSRKQNNKKITEATEEIPIDRENRGKNETRPSLSGNSPKRNERRPFVRRRFGAANATTSTSAAPTTTPVPTTSVITSTIRTSSRRPFRVGSRRRLVSSTSAPATVDDDEVTDPIEEEPPKPRPTKKTVKIQKRPLLALKNQDIDNHPSATNELKEGQRESKKYSSSFKQNQLDDALKIEDTTTESRSTSMDLDAETAVAIATHQLLSAPLPISNNYDYKTTNKPTYDTTYNNIQTIKTTRAPTTTVNSPTVNSPTGFSIQSYSTNIPSTVFYSTTQSPFSTPNDGYSTLRNPGFSSPVFSQPAGFTRSNYPLSSTAKYLGVNQKYVSVPIEEEFGYATESYSGISQEPTYFTREYLLESPVTRTYEDDYQYLSTLTTQEPKPTTAKRILPKKFATRKSPTPITQSYSQTTARSRTPKPYEKIVPVKKVYKPIENYDYYDDSHEKLAGKYSEDTKVVLHDRGVIQCLDIGNFPHPVSCKKFIQCARMESGQLRGWEYVCPKGLSFDPVGGICNWSAGLGCSDH